MKKRLLMLVICISLVMAMGSVAFAADDTAAGDTIWIKNGSYVYKSADVNSDSKELTYHHQVKIKNIITDESGVPAWYEISYSTFDLWAQTILRNYTYIQVENTSVEEPSDEPVDSPVYENFNGELENGSSVNISAVEGIFPENTVVSMEEVAIDEKEYEDAIVNFDSSMKILDSYAVDIQFFSDGVVVQPNGSVILKMTVTNVLVPQDDNMVVLVHMADAGPEIIGSSYLKNGGLNQTFSFSVNSFSSYAAVFVNGKYVSQKMVDALVGQSRYEIRTTYVDLFDYDPAT
ncbi:MAG: hypothetical protein IJC82_02385, partial [Firmicutes bacterium]|nr:hypothetical protein [Bacillota bacterium]